MFQLKEQAAVASDPPNAQGRLIWRALAIDAGEIQEEVKTLSHADMHQRARELAPARKAAEELFRLGKSTLEIVDLLNQRFGGSIGVSTVRTWKSRMETAESADTRTPDLPDPPAGGEESSDEIPPADPPAPADPKSDGEDLWELIMAQRPPWSQKPRLARWMDLANAAYGFLVESDCG